MIYGGSFKLATDLTETSFNEFFFQSKFENCKGFDGLKIYDFSPLPEVPKELKLDNEFWQLIAFWYERYGFEDYCCWLGFIKH